MNEEEVKAIKTIREDIEVYKEKGAWKENSILVKSLRVVLNLIEKQEVELQQEKEKNKELIQRNKALSNNMLSLASNSIRKDKIREKLKELEEEQKEYKEGQEWETQDDIDAQINILKELVEEE